MEQQLVTPQTTPTPVATAKRTLGQYFTRRSLWLLPQVRAFIDNSGTRVAYDPYAGGGDLLSAAGEVLGYELFVGLDIDPAMGWPVNDSLDHIPELPDSIIITNPPYLALNSAKRRGIYDSSAAYFEAYPHYQDLYLVAIEKALEHNRFIVAIIPESFLKSNFRQKARLVSVSVLEENPFDDTDTPVAVACFDEREKNPKQISLYKNDQLIMDMSQFNTLLPKARGHHRISFNDPVGQLALRAVDSTDDEVRIGFLLPADFGYSLKRIKHSSRSMTVLRVRSLDKYPFSLPELVHHANELIEAYREGVADLTLTPFKGNTRGGRRRRRLDYLLARMILEKAIDELSERAEQLARR